MEKRIDKIIKLNEELTAENSRLLDNVCAWQGEYIKVTNELTTANDELRLIKSTSLYKFFKLFGIW